MSFLTLQRGNAVGDALRQKSSSRRRVRIGRGAEHGQDSRDYRSSRSSVGMPWVTLCATNLRRAAKSGSDAAGYQRDFYLFIYGITK
nr:DUF1534 domain-containing protein [Pseudomonas congelans]